MVDDSHRAPRRPVPNRAAAARAAAAHQAAARVPRAGGGRRKTHTARGNVTARPSSTAASQNGVPDQWGRIVPLAQAPSAGHRESTVDRIFSGKCWVKCSTRCSAALGSWTPACTCNNSKPREKATLDFHAKYAHRTRIDACDSVYHLYIGDLWRFLRRWNVPRCGRLQRRQDLPMSRKPSKRPLSYSSFNSRVSAVDTPKITCARSARENFAANERVAADRRPRTAVPPRKSLETSIVLGGVNRRPGLYFHRKVDW